MTHERILLVDDEEDFVTTLSERLETRGLQVSSALNGEDAIALVQQQNFDAVILDLQMPGLDGLETLKFILQHEPDAQVILLTGHATVSTGVQAIKEGAMDFLEKPIEIKDLLKKIGEAASKRSILMVDQSMEKIDEILKKRGW